MKRFHNAGNLLRGAGVFLVGASLAIGKPLVGSGISDGLKTEPSSDFHNTCTFSDGATIAFDQEPWRTGEYEAIPIRVTEHMVIPPMEIPAGNYTLFVIDRDDPPWTLIVSKKAGESGMPYPGKKFDLGRTSMGSDVQRAVKHFTVGCKLIKNGPTFLLMQSGRSVAYVKIMVKKSTKGQTEYLIH